MDVDIDSLETLNLLTREGAQEASDALEQMVDTPTVIDITKLMVADRADITADIQGGTTEGVSFEIDGTLSGTLLFTFDEDCIETITELLVPGDASESMARSSVTELANIMMGGFMTGWGDHLETGLDASPPTYLEAPELDSFEIESLGPDTNSVLAFGSTVTWRDNTVGVDIYLIPDRESIETVVEAEQASQGTDEAKSASDESSGGFGFNQGGGETDGPFAAGDGDDGPFGSGGGASEEADAAEADGPFGGGGDGSNESPFGVPDDATDDDSESREFGAGDDDFGFGMDDDGADSVSLDKLSVFSDLTKEGTEAAAERVTTMTGIETTTEIAGITFTPIEDIPENLEDGEYVGTTGEFEGTPSGHLVIMFDERSAKNIAEAMMPVDPGDEDGLTEMHRSAIEELGNIMTSGFIDGWANVLQTSVDHTPPAFAEDMESAFMGILTDQLGQFQTHAFSIESAMHTDELDFNCKIHALPNEAELEKALDSLMVERRDETDVDPDDLF